MKIEINCCRSGRVLFAHDAENNSMPLTVEAAVKVGAYLARANLAGANLDGELLTKAPLSLAGLKWPVLISNEYMRIGCQRHDHKSWQEFSGDDIRQMAHGALGFWREWKSPLLALCAAHREAAQ